MIEGGTMKETALHEKPRLRLVPVTFEFETPPHATCLGWVCETEGYRGGGMTPREAYNAWLIVTGKVANIRALRKKR